MALHGECAETMLTNVRKTEAFWWTTKLFKSLFGAYYFPSDIVHMPIEIVRRMRLQSFPVVSFVMHLWRKDIVINISSTASLFNTFLSTDIIISIYFKGYWVTCIVWELFDIPWWFKGFYLTTVISRSPAVIFFSNCSKLALYNQR